MLINLTKSKLFTHDPDSRFSKEYAVPKGTWRELWRRHQLLDYTKKDLRDFLFIKYARNPTVLSLDRWILRSQVYSKANPLIRKGVVCVDTNFFGEYEQFVMDELTKQMRYGGKKNSNTII